VAAPEWIKPLLGWKGASAKSKRRCQELFGAELAPNIADLGNVGSLSFAGHVYQQLGIPDTQRKGNLSDADENSSSGAALEVGIEQDIADRLRAADSRRGWIVTRQGLVSQFAQFEHLSHLQSLLDKDPTLRASLARDYQVKTDVYVGVQSLDDAMALPFLHAAISSKWTIRSDRVQNVRHEFTTLVRNRRGRTPHLVLVTAEPQPSRLSSITRGTGEVDAVYHVLFDELQVAVGAVCAANPRLSDQEDDWNEMVDQNRLRPYSRLAADLVTT
jgi:hypothetical protein